ncbi:MAG: MGMT family protein [Actinomycetota bacterium]
MAAKVDSKAFRYAAIETLLGPGWFAYGDDGVVIVETGSEAVFLRAATRALGARPKRDDPGAAFIRRVRVAMQNGDGSVVDWSVMRPFARAVLKATSAIPRGSVCSYAEIAEAIGRPRAARAVGTALARNPVPLLVPCHRVVRSDGSLGEYGMGGARAKRCLLAAEGAVSD